MSQYFKSGAKSLEDTSRAAGLQSILKAQRNALYYQQREVIATGYMNLPAKVGLNRLSALFLSSISLDMGCMMLLPTFRVSLPASNNVLEKVPHKRVQQPVFLFIPDPDKLTTKISNHS